MVLLNGDTIKGQIDYKKWETNPLKIKFTNGSSPVNYSPRDLRSFTVNGLDDYKSAIVEKDMRPVDIQGLLHSGDKELPVTDTVFLRLITTGNKVALYELLDTKIHYYIEEGSNKQPEELIYKKYLTDDNMGLIEKPHFRNQLTRLSANNNSNSLAHKIEKCQYDETGLSTIIRIINGADAKTAEAIEATKKRPVQIMVGGGIELYSTYIDAGQYENKIAPIVNAAVDMFPARGSKILAVRLQLSYLPIKYETHSKTSTNSSFSQSNLLPEMNLVFHFINRQTWKMYGGFGVGANISLYTTKSFYNPNPTAGLSQSWSYSSGLETGVFRSFVIGAKIIDKINLSISTKIGGTEDNVSLNGKFFPLGFNASYIIFSKRKGQN